jgi:hypothetical protein
VFSDRALEFLRGDDEALHQYLTPHFENWPKITIVHNDTVIPIAGNGFASIGRLEFLTLLYDCVERLGVKLQFGTEITTLEQMGKADLIVGANGHFRGFAARTRTGLAPRPQRKLGIYESHSPIAR